MTILSTDNAHFPGLAEGRLRQIFRPIAADLKAVAQCLSHRLETSRDDTVDEVLSSLRHSPGKRLRPALVLLAHQAARTMCDARAGSERSPVQVAAAMELIHMASLVHDDFIDDAPVRHHRSSVNARWGGAVSVALGDYLCAGAFQLIAECGDPQMFVHLGSALCAMCEGEMRQVMSRGDFALSEQDCLAVVEKKTAALFAACCAAGARAAGAEEATLERLRRFGGHLGIAFQVLDDCRDLLSDQTLLGKKPAQDLLVGDVTLPVVLLLEEAGLDHEALAPVDPQLTGAQSLDGVRKAFHDSGAAARTGQRVRLCIDRATQELQPVAESESKRSLCLLANFMGESASEILAR